MNFQMIIRNSTPSFQGPATKTWNELFCRWEGVWGSRLLVSLRVCGTVEPQVLYFHRWKGEGGRLGGR